MVEYMIRKAALEEYESIVKDKSMIFIPTTMTSKYKDLFTLSSGEVKKSKEYWSIKYSGPKGLFDYIQDALKYYEIRNEVTDIRSAIGKIFENFRNPASAFRPEQEVESLYVHLFKESWKPSQASRDETIATLEKIIDRIELS